MEEIIGSLAAICTTVSFLPQAIKVLRTKHTKDISLAMYIIFVLGVSLWLIYGILLSKPPIIFANAITLPLVITILYTKIKHG